MNDLEDYQLELILEHIFTACDSQKSGFIKVLTIINFINTDVKLESNIKECFIEVLRPYNRDYNIDIITLQSIFFEFTKQSRDFEKVINSDIELEDGSSYAYDSINYSECSNSSNSHEGCNLSTKTNYLEIEELQNKLDDVEIRNIKLNEERKQLIEQLNNLEDAYSILNQKYQIYEVTIKTNQQGTIKDQHDLKLLETEKIQLQSIVNKLKVQIEINQEEFKSKIASISEDLEFANSKLTKYKEKTEELQKLKDNDMKKYQLLLQEKEYQLEDLSSDFMHLETANKELKSRYLMLQESLEETELNLKQKMMVIEELNERCKIIEAENIVNTNSLNKFEIPEEIRLNSVPINKEIHQSIMEEIIPLLENEHFNKNPLFGKEFSHVNILETKDNSSTKEFENIKTFLSEKTIECEELQKQLDNLNGTIKLMNNNLSSNNSNLCCLNDLSQNTYDILRDKIFFQIFGLCSFLLLIIICISLINKLICMGESITFHHPFGRPT